MADNYFVGTRVKEYLDSKVCIKAKGNKCRWSGDSGPALNNLIEKVIDKAVERANANDRATVMPQDL